VLYSSVKGQHNARKAYGARDALTRSIIAGFLLRVWEETRKAYLACPGEQQASPELKQAALDIRRERWVPRDGVPPKAQWRENGSPGEVLPQE
jgi:hypothetical protein